MISALAAMDAAVADNGGLAEAGSADQTFVEGPPIAYAYLKRTFDFVVAAVVLVAMLPLILIVVLAIWLDDRGPAFYRQQRVGVRGRRRGRRITWEERPFRIVKFRTMIRDADRQPVHEDFIKSFVRDGHSSEYKLSADVRVTRVGKLLRATSLDELPQLINVLGGTMSVVGPRPVPPYEVALYQPQHRERLAAMPGITGMWQVLGRGRVGFEEMVRLDIEYVRHQSLRLDLALLARTLPAVFLKRGAR